MKNIKKLLYLFLGATLVMSCVEDDTTFELNGENLDGIKDNSLDLIATYSVLHHIPDYIKTIHEMIRVCAPGGIIYIDHEQNNEYWIANEEYKEFQKKVNKVTTGDGNEDILDQLGNDHD